MTSPNKRLTAEDIREQAAEWLFRANASDFTSDEKSDLETWLDASEFNRAAYWRLEAAWVEAARLAALTPAPKRSDPLRDLLAIRVLKSAAALVVASIAGVTAYQYLSAPTTRAYATAVGGHRTLTLPDGTLIDLNTDTVIKISEDLSTRRVWLERGEALFEVKHNAEHPFTVVAGNHRITDLGTKFIVRQSKEGLQVSLLEGRAQLEPIGSQDVHSTELSPGEVAVASHGTMSVTRVPIRAIANELSWRKGLLVFDDTTLVDAVSEFNRYNADKIVLSDPSIRDMRVNGTFPVHARHDFAEVTRAVFGLKAEDKGNQIVISR